MMIQATISLAVLALLVARAVNIPSVIGARTQGVRNATAGPASNAGSVFGQKARLLRFVWQQPVSSKIRR